MIIPPVPGLEFREKGHIHLLDGCEVPGCSTVSGLFDKGDWRCAWASKMAIDKVSSILDHDGRLCRDPGDTIEGLLKGAKNAWRQKRDLAADDGTALHKELENYIKYQINDTTPYVIPWGENTRFYAFREALRQFYNWEEEHWVEWMGSEVQVASKVHRFAGILDWLGMVDGVLTLGDFKTGKEVYPQHAIQMAGLMICLNEVGLYPQQRIILHIPKDGPFEAVFMNTDIVADKIAFLSGLDFLNHRNLLEARYE